MYLHLTEGYWGSSTYMGHGEFSQRLSGAPSDVINPNELGFVIATAVPFLHYLLWPGSKKAKLLYLALMPPLLYALILTQSRGALLALIVVAFFVLKQSSKKFVLILVAIAIAVASWQVMNPEQKDRYLSLLGDSHTKNAASAEGRLNGMIREFQIGFSRPIVGYGLGTTPEAKAHILNDREASHTLYAELLIELGIIGTVIFLAFMIRIHRKLGQIAELDFSDDGNDSRFYENLRYALVAVFWMYVVYSSNYWGLSQYYWYLFGGLVLAFHKLSVADSEKSAEAPADDTKSHRFPLAKQIESNLQRQDVVRR
jgi:O-antigen ligase